MTTDREKKHRRDQPYPTKQNINLASFGKFIRWKRRILLLTVAELSELVGISRKTLHRYERHGLLKRVNVRTIRRLCYYLEIDITCVRFGSHEILIDTAQYNQIKAGTLALTEPS